MSVVAGTGHLNDVSAADFSHAVGRPARRGRREGDPGRRIRG